MADLLGQLQPQINPVIHETGKDSIRFALVAIGLALRHRVVFQRLQRQVTALGGLPCFQQGFTILLQDTRVVRHHFMGFLAMFKRCPEILGRRIHRR